MLAAQQHELLVSGPPLANQYIYQAIVLSSGASSALVIWDAILTLGDEVEYIWLGSSRTLVKCIYLFSRWIGLLNQTVIVSWRYFVVACAPVPLSICEGLYAGEAVAFVFLQLSMDAILILRIWAVYQRQFRYIAISLAIVLFEVIMFIVTQTYAVPESIVDGACTILHTPTMTTCLAIGIMVSQSVLLSLTYRGIAMSVPRRSKLTLVVVRDAMLVFLVVVGIIFTTLFYYLFNQAILNFFFPWMTVLPSLLTPRIILNMQMAAEPTESILEFTTDLGTLPNNEVHPLSTLHGVPVVI